MSLKFNCTNCQNIIIIRFLKVGESAKCKKCGSNNIVPNDALALEDKYFEQKINQDINNNDSSDKPISQTKILSENESIDSCTLGEDLKDQDPEFVTQVQNFINKPDSKLNSLANLGWLLFSILLFVGVGTLFSSPSYIFIIVLIIIIHEAGHLIGMKLFHYNNVRMLFIPAMGAVAMGKQTSSRADHAAIVALLGPVPGLAIGIVFTIIAINNNFGWLLEYGKLSILLNTFNLLPIMPLDGGRVLQHSLFSKYPTCRLIVLVLSVVLLAGMAIMLESTLLGIIAFITLVSISFASQETKIVKKLNKDPKWLNRKNDKNITREFIAYVLSYIQLPNLTESKKIKFSAERVKNIWDQFSVIPPSLMRAILITSVLILSFSVGVSSFIVYAEEFQRSEYKDSPTGNIISLYDAREFEQLIIEYDKLDEKTKSLPSMLEYVGFSYHSMKYYDMALETFRLLDTKYPLRYDTNFMLGQVFDKLNNDDSAICYYLKSIEKYPDSTLSRSSLGIIALRHGDYQLALKYAEDNYKKNEKDAELAANLSFAFHSNAMFSERDSLCEIAGKLGYDKLQSMKLFYQQSMDSAQQNN